MENFDPTSQQSHELINILEKRFKTNKQRHPDLKWETIHTLLLENPQIIRSLSKMEATGGEPDIVTLLHNPDEIVFYDCSPESPKGRRSICYDQEALDSRKQHKPHHSAVAMAQEMGVQLIDEAQYIQLQEVLELDLKTSSWLWTTPELRKRGGAIFGDRRYDRVFIYHNGAESYYAARGFRGYLKLK